MQQHWERVYKTKPPEQVSWFSPHLETSLTLIERALDGNRDAAIVDVGGGASTLVDDLVEKGFRNLTVLDISQAALDVARQRLGKRGEAVRWVRADVTEWRPGAHSIDLWHDRAVFHFLTSASDRRAYVQSVAESVKPGGHVIVGTFGPEGPLKCSGLEVEHYDASSLHAAFGARFELVESRQELHETPFGAVQQFVYCYCTLQPHP